MSYAYRPLDSKNAKTCRPSVMAELDAHVPSFIEGCARRSSARRPLPDDAAGAPIDCQHDEAMDFSRLDADSRLVRRAPVDADRHRGDQNRRSPHTTGDADPRPGISTFHRMFLVSLHSMGGLARLETPLAWVPRHCGQNRSPAGSVAVRTHASSAVPTSVARPTAPFLTLRPARPRPHLCTIACESRLPHLNPSPRVEALAVVEHRGGMMGQRRSTSGGNPADDRQRHDELCQGGGTRLHVASHRFG